MAAVGVIESIGADVHPLKTTLSEHIPAEDAPRLPTKSMVSIRLSDSNASQRPTMSTSDAIVVQDHTTVDAHRHNTISGDAFCAEPEDHEPERGIMTPQISQVHEPEPEHDDEFEKCTTALDQATNTRCMSGAETELSDSTLGVDWDELEKTEEQEPRDEGSDESTAFLLARLEQENNALATDPKAGLTRAREASWRPQSQSRPPSIHHLKKLFSDPAPSSLRYSLLPSPPPMTDLEFYAALVADFPRTAQHLPTLLSKKIRAGIPPPLRGVVWVSMAGARDTFLESQYERLSGAPSPYEHLIGKDIGRSFPGVDMFREENGDGQQQLGRVLKSFSLYDHTIGYCQGLGFLVGPLLMHMGEMEAFCVLVRLMEHYDLRSCYLPDLAGLHLRIYQYQRLLAHHLPVLSAHLEALQIEAGYVSQWFLSFFAVTCPLPMLLRIYDVILAEGASETLMRVALSLMRRNERKILACTELEDVMQLLLCRGLWDVYKCNADDLVNDFVSFTGVVTNDGLQSLATTFRDAKAGDVMAKLGSLPDLQTAASRFLGRLWAGSVPGSKSVTLSPGTQDASRPNSVLRRTLSKQSMASTFNSSEGAGSDGTASTVLTDVSTLSRQMSVESVPSKVVAPAAVTLASRHGSHDRDLHVQIEDLLTALSGLQRDQAVLTTELQREREAREEDRKVVVASIDRFRPPPTLEEVIENEEVEAEERAAEDLFAGIEAGIGLLEDRFVNPSDARRYSSMETTKYQLREELLRSQEQYTCEVTRSRDLGRRLAEQGHEIAQLRDEVKETRARVQDGHREKQRLERSVYDFRLRQSSSTSMESTDSRSTVSVAKSDLDMFNPRSSVHAGLREFKLNRTAPPVFAKRTSSLQLSPVSPVPQEAAPSPTRDDSQALLMELVNSKTAEATAKQEAVELRGKLEHLRKMLGGGNSSAAGSISSLSSGPRSDSVPAPPEAGSRTSSPIASPAGKDEATSWTSPIQVPAASLGSFWGTWGKRSLSTSVPTDTPS